jgi:hypothetical protein
MIDRLQQFFHRVTSIFRRKKLDHDLDAELAAHLELAIEENLQRGLSPEEARRQALIRFGGKQQAIEQHRDARGLPGLETDLRSAIEQADADLPLLHVMSMPVIDLRRVATYCFLVC